MNYPEDIKNYSNNHRSPTYDDSMDMWIESRATEIAKQIISDSIADVLEFIAGSTVLTIEYETRLSGLASKTGADQLYRAEMLAAWMQEQAEKVALPLAEMEAQQWEAEHDELPQMLRRQAS